MPETDKKPNPENMAGEIEELRGDLEKATKPTRTLCLLLFLSSPFMWFYGLTLSLFSETRITVILGVASLVMAAAMDFVAGREFLAYRKTTRRLRLLTKEG